jgi:hypothetical protein
MMDDIISSLTPNEKNDLNDLLNQWNQSHPYGQRIVRNFYIEHFLPKTSLNDLVSFILSKKSFPIVDIQNEYQKECYNYTRQGGDVIWNSKAPKYFGTAIEKSVFVNHLMSNYRSSFPKKKDALNFIEYLKSGVLSRHKMKLNLKMYSIWTTWNESDFDSYPFEYCITNDADEIRANMGLDKLLNSNEILLFIYSIPANFVKRPTIADAGLSQYFEPPIPSFNNHGLTRTWEMEKKYTKYNMKPRPEGIHNAIDLSNLELPLQYK